MEFQSKGILTFLLLWEYKNSNAEKKRTNKRLIVDIQGV